MPRFPAAQGRLNHDPRFHLSCDENLSEGWGPPLLFAVTMYEKLRGPLPENKPPGTQRKTQTSTSSLNMTISTCAKPSRTQQAKSTRLIGIEPQP